MRVLCFFPQPPQKVGGALTLADVGLTLGCVHMLTFLACAPKSERGPVLNLRARDVATTLADVGGGVFFWGFFGGGAFTSLDVRALRLFPPSLLQGKKLSFQFTCPFGQVQCVFCLSEPQNYLSKNRQPQQY